MIGRLQFKHDNKLYTSKEAIKAMLDVTVKDIDGKYALFAEPIVFKYGEDENDTSTWNIVLAIGKYGDGTQHSKNEYFLIDTATLEKDVATVQEELANKSEDLDAELERINSVVEDLQSRMETAEGNIDTLFGEIERIDTELAKKVEFPDLKLIYDPTNDENNGGAIRLEWGGHTYIETQSIPIRDFIKDAMVKEATVITKEDGKPYLHIVWNDDANKPSTDIPLNMLVDIYTVCGSDGSTDYLRIDENNVLHINVWDGNGYPYDGLATGSQVHDLEDVMNANISSANTRINTLNADLLRETAARENADNDIISDLETLSGVVISNKTDLDADVDELKAADVALANAINAIPTYRYDIVKTDELTYSLCENGQSISTISIPKDMIVTGAEVKDGMIYIYINALDEFGNQKFISFPIDDLIDTYTVAQDSTQYMSVNNNAFSLKVDTPSGLASYTTARLLNNEIDDVAEDLNTAVRDINSNIDDVNRSLDNKLEGTDLDLVYDETNKLIKLTGKNGALLGLVSTDAFVKDGMISNVELVEHSLVITWNTDAGDRITTIPLSSLVKVYTVAEDSVNYLSIDPITNKVSIKIGSEENQLGLASYTQYKGLKDIVGSGFSETTITEEVANIKAELGDQVYSPEMDGDVATAIAVGGIPTGTTVSDLSGKSMTEMFNEILFPEVYPSTPTKPSVTAINGGNLTTEFDIQNGLALVDDEISISAVSATTSAGKFNAPFAIPNQPTPFYETGLTLSVEYTGLKSATAPSTTSYWSANIGLGNNTITWTANMSYSAPSNKPLTSYGNETTETGKTATNGAATWANGSSVKTKVVTIKGVYPIFTNVSGAQLMDNADTMAPLFSGATSVEISVPSESANQKHFILDYPASKNVVKLLIKDLSGNFVDFSSPYNANTETVRHKLGDEWHDYKRLVTTGSLLGSCVYKLVLNSSMDR